jgi:hypothetical protein
MPCYYVQRAALKAADLHSKNNTLSDPGKWELLIMSNYAMAGAPTRT